jgi:hypothetical protein
LAAEQGAFQLLEQRKKVARVQKRPVSTMPNFVSLRLMWLVDADWLGVVGWLSIGEVVLTTAEGGDMSTVTCKARATKDVVLQLVHQIARLP